MTKKSSKSKSKKKSKRKNNDNDNDKDDNNDDNDENEKSLKILSKKVLRIQKNYVTNTTKSFIKNDGFVALSSLY
jgi:hypothetical protein